MVNGAKIRSLREENKLTVEKAATEVGITHAMLVFVERGQRQPSVDTLVRIADYFGVKIDDLIIRANPSDIA